ncbi:MAG: phosphatidylglycerophosphatase A, partial [Leptonema sp. (in: bacteria)]
MDKKSIYLFFLKIPFFLFLSFLLFIIFDSFKPFPANKAQNLKGGLGV